MPRRPGVYIVHSPIETITGRPLYIGKTKRDVNTRMSEHLRANDDAVPLFYWLSTVEFRPAQNNAHARALERRLQAERKPHYGTGRHIR